MVLVDARSEYVDDRLTGGQEWAEKRAAHLQAWAYGIARRIGIARSAGASLLGVPASLPDDTRRTMALLASTPNARNTASAEFRERATSDERLRSAPSLGDRPLRVLAASDSMEKLANWPEAQQAMAALSSKGQLVVVEDSGHSIHWEHPAEVIAAVQTVVATAPLATTDSR
jgi:pimeloyl-ACP methyl ester carboxylesterase